MLPILYQSGFNTEGFPNLEGYLNQTVGTLGRQQVNAMAGRGRNQPQPQPLQGADPALVQILQMMQNRNANRDNSRKQFLMFPKESFTGQDKKLAKSHWAKFSKYLDYQNQQGTIPRDLAHLPDIKSMFKLTL